MKRTSAICVVLMVIVAGCQRQTSTNMPVAKIDDQTLTVDDIRFRFDSSRGFSQSQLQQYLQRWIRDELLYREAVSRGLGTSKEIDEQLEKARRQLVINALLEREVYNEKSESSTPEEIRAYYDTHKDEFLLRSDMALVSYMVFSDRDAASSFRNTVLRGTPWGEAVRLTLSHSEQMLKVLTKGDSLYHTQASLLPAELWRVASSTPANQPSFPIRTSEGYYVILVWKFARLGQPADVRFFEGEIRSRLSMERRSKLYNSLVENLRAKHSVQILVGSSGGDSTRTKSVE